MPPTAEAAEQFLAAPVLSEMDAVFRRAVLEHLSEARAPAGAVLLEQGQPNDHLSFLIGGSARIVRAYPGGHEELVATLHAPALFGESSFFRAGAPLVSVVAVGPAWVLSLDHPAHERLRLENARAAEALALVAVRVLAERFDMIDRRVSEMLRDGGDAPRTTEWARFRAQLFEEARL